MRHSRGLQGVGAILLVLFALVLSFAVPGCSAGELELDQPAVEWVKGSRAVHDAVSEPFLAFLDEKPPDLDAEERDLLRGLMGDWDLMIREGEQVYAKELRRGGDR